MVRHKKPATQLRKLAAWLRRLAAQHPKLAAWLGKFAGEFVLLCALGGLVAVAMWGLLQLPLDFLHALDRKASDLMMQQLASERLGEPDAAAPRFVFVDIDEQTCEEWAIAAGMSCTKGWATPRNQLAAILEALAAASGDAQQRPRLLVIDVELAPVAHRDAADPSDDRLCAAIVHTAQSLPVVALRPMIIRPDPNGVLVDAYPSILDAAFGNDGHCAGGDATGGAASSNLWLASALIQPDSEGVVRSVHAWDTIDSPPGFAGRIGGVGFLGAALLEPKASIAQLACAFPASKPVSGPCADAAVTIADRVYRPSTTASQQNRIVFLVPYTPSGVTGGSLYGYAPSTIETVAAKDFVGQNPSRSKLLGGAVVVLGGSFRLSDDLYTTPLDAGMPGAIVHANAIRGFATAALVEEQESCRLEVTLIFVAAIIGALFHAFGSPTNRIQPTLVDDLREFFFSIVGVCVMVGAVFFVAVTLAFDDLSRTGTALGTLTPALAVAFEGLSTVMNLIKKLMHRAIAWINRRVRGAIT